MRSSLETFLLGLYRANFSHPPTIHFFVGRIVVCACKCRHDALQALARTPKICNILRQFTGLVAVVPSTGLASSVVRDTTLEGDGVKPPHHRLTNLVTRPRSIGSPAPIHPTLPARTHPLQRELGARSHRNCESGRGVSASAKFGCRLQTQPHQPTCRLAPTLVASMAPERTPEDGSASSRSEDTHIEPPPHC